MMVLAMAAPHGPEDPAPQYKDLLKGIKAPRTPSYNYTSKDKHWIVRVSEPLDDLRADFTDLLYRRRLLTMLSLDDAIAKIYNMLKETNELENTYIFFSSDHGFHIGQFNLIKGKSQPYETDIRVPLYVRGPGVIASQRIDQIALNIDLAPTFLDIAGVKRPSFMDGTSLLPLLRRNIHSSMANPIHWRDTFLVQRGIMIKLNNTMTFLKYSPINTNRLGKKRASICQSPNRPLPPCTRAKKRVCVMMNGVYDLQDCTPTPKTISMQQKNKGCQCKIPDPLVPGEQALPNNVLTKLPLRAKAKMKVFSDRQMYRLMMSGHLSVDQLRKVFARELARIKRKFRKRSLRYLRHLRVDKATVKVKAKKQFEKRNNGTVFHKKMKKIDRKISDARKRLDALRERRRMLKIKTSTGVATPLVREPIIPPQSKQPKKICECEPKKERRKKTKQKKKSRRRNLRNMKCFYHTPDHWRTPPFWTRGSFSSCKNSPNNTFWCLRKINATHNFIYCRFVTSFVEYYDLIRDPYQLTNQQQSLSPETTNEFERQLAILRDCKGREDCTMIDGRTLRQIKEGVERTQASSFSDTSSGRTS